MTASENLRQTWDIVRREGWHAGGYFHRRIPAAGNLAAYAGLVYPEGYLRISLLVDTSAVRAVPLRDESKGYTVDVEHAPVGHPLDSFIHITARETTFSELFAILSADVVEQWVVQDHARSAVLATHRRLQHWRKFFMRGGCLSREAYIGLFAELTYLETILNSGFNAEQAVEAWQGPLGANQDFLFGPVAVEVKGSVGNDPDTVRIANERQLDSTGLEGLFLFHVVYDLRENTGRTLRQLIATLRDRLSLASPPALLVVDERLLAAGYVEQIPCPSDAFGFAERTRASYALGDGFPRIVETTLPSGITDVCYQLNLAVCAAYQVDTAAVVKTAKNGAEHGR
jgi:hypothetical protein